MIKKLTVKMAFDAIKIECGLLEGLLFDGEICEEQYHESLKYCIKCEISNLSDNIGISYYDEYIKLYHKGRLSKSVHVVYIEELADFIESVIEEEEEGIL